MGQRSLASQSPLGQTAVHAAASERIVLPVSAPETTVEFAKEQLVAARALKVELMVANHEECQHPHRCGQKDRATVAPCPRKFTAHEMQDRKVQHKDKPERSTPSPVALPRR